MQSVVTGQAPITLEWKITSGRKSYYCLQLKYFVLLISTLYSCLLNYLLYLMSDICRRHKGRFALNINIKYCTENG